MTDTIKTTMKLHKAIDWMFKHPKMELEYDGGSYDRGEAQFDGDMIVFKQKYESEWRHLLLFSSWIDAAFTIPKSKLDVLKAQQDKELLKLRQSLTCDSCDISSESIYNLGLKHQQERDALEREKQ